MFVPRDTALIAGAEAQKTLKSARAVVLLGLFGAFSALVLLVFHWIGQRATEQLTEKLGGGTLPPEVAQQTRGPILMALFDLNEAQVASLTSLPLALFVLLKATWMFLPLYIAIMGFDQLSGEIGPRSIRYLVIRTPRSSVLLGKWLAQVAVLGCLVLAVQAGSALFIAAVDEELRSWVALVTFLRFFGVTALFALTYTALATFCSAVARTPAVSLTSNLIALFGFWLLATIGGMASEGSTWSLLKYASPWHFASRLVHPELSSVALAAGAHLGFAALFLIGAWLSLKDEDL